MGPVGHHRFIGRPQRRRRELVLAEDMEMGGLRTVDPEGKEITI